MPKTTEFAARSLNFQNHYSGGNGTRQGLFSLFYGIYGTYWASFLVEERGPVLFDALQQQNYQVEMYSSASFTYPEFDKTIFAQIPSAQLHQLSSDLSPWERDAVNVSHMLEFIDDRQQAKPFFTFIFFESTHARYYFPDVSAIRSPYLADVNYATMSRSSLHEEIEQLKNRYINASHYLDSQFERVFQYLECEGLLESTIVLITGDHGEEFMEKGHWGHNAGFSEEQVRTPMIIHLPGVEARSFSRLSSHMDMIATILPYLGVKNPISDYSLGENLISGIQTSNYKIASDWAGISYINLEHKFAIPFKGSFARNSLQTRDDLPVENDKPFLVQHQAELMRVLVNARKYLKYPPSG